MHPILKTIIVCRLEFRLYIITNSIIWELYFTDMLAMEFMHVAIVNGTSCIVVAKQF